LNPSGRDPGQQRLFAVEMAVERGAGDAEPGSHRAQGQRRDAVVPDHTDGGLDQRPLEVAMVIGALFSLWDGPFLPFIHMVCDPC
jgi:hypothetical protein